MKMKMNNNILLCIMMCALSIFYSCNKDIDSDEQGVSLVLNMPNENLAEINIRVFNSNGILIELYNFATSEEVSSALLPLTTGDYTLVTTVNTNEYFTVTEQVGKTTLDELLFTMNEPYYASSHAYYGVTDATVVDGADTQVTIDMARVFSELELTFNGFTDDILKVEMTIHNTSKGFYPAVQKLTAEFNSTYIGIVDVINNTAKFPVTRLMPSVAMSAKNRADTEIKTSVEFTLHYVSGEKVTTSVTIPKIDSGGTYDPEIDFEVLRPEVVVDITDIKGWGEGSDNVSEILDPM